jgi:DNA-binding CsgD family transcriptional regulator
LKTSTKIEEQGMLKEEEVRTSRLGDQITKKPARYPHDLKLIIEKRGFWFLGFGFYWAWMSVAFFTPTLFPSTVSVVAITAQQVWITWATAALLLRIILIPFSARIVTLVDRTAVVVLSIFLGGIGTILIPLGNYLTNSLLADEFWISFLGAIIAGLGSGLSSLMWGETYKGLNSNESFFAITLAFLVAAVLHFLISALPPMPGICAAVALQVACGCCLFKERRSISNTATDTPSSRPKTGFSIRIIFPLVVIFFYASCGELFHTFTALPGEKSDLVLMGNFYTAGGALGMLAMLLVTIILSAILGRRVEDSTYLRLSFLFMAIGMILPAVFNMSFLVSYAIFGAAFWCFRNVVWIYSTKLINYLDVSPIAVFGISQGTYGAAIVIGSPTVRALAQSLHLGTIAWINVAIILVFLVFAFAVFLSSSKDLKSMWGLLPNSELAADSLDKNESLRFLLNDYKLSKRELEVATYLIKGRSLPFIQKELYISAGTAKTHLRHIYQKTGVHNRQAFIDFIDQNRRR